MARLAHDPSITGERHAAMRVATVRLEGPPRSAGVESPSPTCGAVKPTVSRAFRRPGFSVGPSVPTLPASSAPSASRSDAVAPFSTRRGDPAGGGLQKSLRPAPWARDAVERDPRAVGAALMTLEDKVVDPAMLRGCQRPYRLLFVFPAISAASSMASGRDQPSKISRVGERAPLTIGTSLLDYCGCFRFSGSTLHRLEGPKAVSFHLVGHLVMLRDLGRSLMALQGFPKIAPGTRRAPLLGPTLGASSGAQSLEGCCEIAPHLTMRFVRVLTPAGVLDTRGSDVVTNAVTLIIDLASNDTSNATVTAQQDLLASPRSDIFSLSKDALVSRIRSLGFTDSTVKTATRSSWTFGHVDLKRAVCRAVAPLGLPEGFSRASARPGSETNDVLEECRLSTEGQAGTRQPPETALGSHLDPGVAARYSNSCGDEAITYGEKSFSKREALRQALKSEGEVALLIVQRLGHGPTTSKFAPPVTNRNLMKKGMEAVSVMETSKTTRIMRAPHVARKAAGRAAHRRPAPAARRRPAAACRH